MKYEPVELLKLAFETAAPYVRDLDDSNPGRVVLENPDGSRTEKVITYTQHRANIVTAASIMLAESGGDSDARCYNIDGPDGRPTCSPTGPAGPRGVDRGLWQWNSVAWPQITDAVAFDPIASTAMAYKVSAGFTEWGPWTGSKGLDPNSEPSKQIRAIREYDGYTDAVADTVAGAVPGVSTILGWADALGRLLSNLISADWWRRVGIGVAGVALVIIAIIILNRGNIAAAARLAA